MVEEARCPACGQLMPPWRLLAVIEGKVLAMEATVPTNARAAIDLFHALSWEVREGKGRWEVSQETLAGLIQTLKDGNGERFYPTESGRASSFLGKPLVVDETVPEGRIRFRTASVKVEALR